ncbi:MAG: GAF domain-containing sensor histidine kinase [Chloroflexi bacterium]|nr:GAF domain-containing sensor histidine kinase [Chloroflexota bacterium]
MPEPGRNTMRATEASVLLELMRQGAIEREPQRVIDIICRRALDLTGADYSGIRLADEDGHLTWNGMSGNRTQQWRQQRRSSNTGSSTRALREGQTIVSRTRDMAGPPDPHSVRGSEGGEVELATPLRYSGRPLGSLILGWRTEVAPTEAQIRASELLAGYGAAVLDNARSHAEYRRRRDEAVALAELVRRGAAEHDPDGAIAVICEQGRQLVGADYSAVVLVTDEGQREWRWQLGGNLIGEGHASNRHRGMGLNSQAMRSTEPIVVDHVDEQPDPSRFHTKEGGKTAVVAPCIGRAVRGVLHFGWRREVRVSHHQRRLIEALAGYAAVIIENASAHATLRLANEQLLRVDEMKSNLISNVSHELRTPLSSIRAFSEMLLDPDVGAETRVEFSGIINSESERLTRLVTNLLDLSRLQARSVAWHIHPLDVREQLDLAATGMRPLAEPKNLPLIVETPDGLGRVLADADGLQQVLVNLLSNAVKFATAGPIRLHASREGADSVRVSVADGGPGIDPDEQSHIFDRFYQAGDVLTSRPTGSGLGLTITKEILGQLGSDLRLESAVGQGTTFSFALPLAS